MKIKYLIIFILFFASMITIIQLQETASAEKLYLMPTGNGTYNEFSLHGDDTNWECIDEYPTDSSSTYIVGEGNSTIVQRQSISFENVSGMSGQINNVTLFIKRRQSDASQSAEATLSAYVGVDDVYTTWMDYVSYTSEWWKTFAVGLDINPVTGESFKWDEINTITVQLNASGNFTLGEDFLTLYPEYDGNVTDIHDASMSGSSPVWDDVDDDPSDGDTTYVDMGSSGIEVAGYNLYNIDNTTCEYLGYVGQIYNLTVYHTSKLRAGPGATKEIKPILHVGGTNYYGDYVTMTSDYTTYAYEWEQNPECSCPWWTGALNDTQIGHYDHCANTYLRTTQCFAVVCYEDEVSSPQWISTVWLVIDYVPEEPNVTTNATTSTFCSNATVRGYTKDIGNDTTNVTTWFEYGTTVAYGNSTRHYNNFTYDDAESYAYFVGDDIELGNEEDAWDEDWTTGPCYSLNWGVNATLEGDFYEYYNNSPNTNDSINSIDFTALLLAMTSDGATVNYTMYMYNFSSDEWDELFKYSSDDDDYHNVNHTETVYNPYDYIENRQVITRINMKGDSGNNGEVIACYEESRIVFNTTYASEGSEFSCILDDLLPDTVYHYRAAINNSNSTQYGEDMTFSTSLGIVVNNATNIEEDTVSLNGQVDYGSGYSCGFWLGNVSTNSTNFEQNVSCGGTYSTGESFSASASGLTPGEYYYVRAWYSDGDSFNTTSLENYFITRPNAPTSLVATAHNFTAINLTWTNSTIGANTNHSVLIRYSTTNYPTTIDSGTFGANESAYSNVTISNLDLDTKYYFSAWTYVNDSGSPLLADFSSSFDTASNETGGGNYTIFVRYENYSYGLVNLSRWGAHRLIIHHENETDYISFDNGVVVSDVVGGFANISNGSFTVTVDKEVRFFEFRWNDSNNYNHTGFYCTRILIPSSDRNITFYIRTDLTVYAESSSYFNGSLVKYSYSFLDETGSFSPSANARAFIYTYDSDGNRLLIQNEYFDSERKVHPWLVFDKKYYIGVSCDYTHRDRLGIAPTGTDLDPTEIRIPYELNMTYNFFDLINFNYGWYADGLYAHYIDTTSDTDSVIFIVYGLLNNTHLHNESATVSNKNFTFTLAEGCNLSNDYRIDIIANLTGDYAGTYRLQGGGVPIYAGMTGITDNGTLDYWLTLMFGPSPVVNTDTGVFVPWTYLLIFGFCFVLISTVGKLNAFLGGFAVGISLVFFGGAISGIVPLFPEYFIDPSGASLFVVGAFIAVVSFIGLIGGVER